MIYVPSKRTGRAARGRSRSTHARRAQPWIMRRTVLFPLLFIAVALCTIAFCWWNIPVTNPLTGEKETYGTRVQRTVQNIVQPKQSLTTSFGGRRAVSILLVGLDHVPPTPGDPGIIRRADSVLATTTNFDTKQIRIVSIPRDGWVRHWRGGQRHGWEKLGHSYAFGQQSDLSDPLAGVHSTEQTTEHLLDMDLDFYVVIEFEGLVKLVDQFGGLTVDVEKDMKYTDRAGGLYIDLKKGEQHLTGEEVVQYARFRKDALGDIGRMARQQKVIKLILQEMMQAKNLTKLPQLAQLFQDSVKTNLSPDQLLALAQHMDEYSPDAIQTRTLQSYWNREPGHEIELPGTNNQSIQAQYIYSRDADKARNFLLDLEPPPPPEPEPEESADGETGADGGGEVAANTSTGG